MKEGSNEQHHSNRQQGNRNPRPSPMVERRLPLRGDVNQDRVQGHRQLFAADVDALPGVGFAFHEVQWLSKDGSSSDGPLTTIVPFNNIESIEQVETVEAEDGGLK